MKYIDNKEISKNKIENFVEKFNELKVNDTISNNSTISKNIRCNNFEININNNKKNIIRRI